MCESGSEAAAAVVAVPCGCLACCRWQPRDKALWPLPGGPWLQGPGAGQRWRHHDLCLLSYCRCLLPAPSLQVVAETTAAAPATAALACWCAVVRQLRQRRPAAQHVPESQQHAEAAVLVMPVEAAVMVVPVEAAG